MQGAPAPHQKVPVFPGCHVAYSLRLPDATRPYERVSTPAQHPLLPTKMKTVGCRST